MGHSEAGHVNPGVERIVYQHSTRLDKALIEGKYFTNEALINAVKAGKARAKEKVSTLASTILSLMEMEIPQEMTGKPLFIVE